MGSKFMIPFHISINGKPWCNALGDYFEMVDRAQLYPPSVCCGATEMWRLTEYLKKIHAAGIKEAKIVEGFCPTTLE